MTKLLAAALMSSTLLAAPALAQQQPQPAPAMKEPTAAQSQPVQAQPKTMTTAGQTMQQSGQWRASKLVGLGVYNSQNEKIGDINELITGSEGKISTIVVGVGGFLGIGEHNVGLSWDQVKFVNEPVRAAATDRSASPNRPATTGTGMATTTASGPRDYPDHAMVNMTKDQLKGLPAFKYASDRSTDTNRDAGNTRAR